MSKISICANSHIQYTVREDGDFLQLDFCIDEISLEKILMPRSMALLLVQEIYKDFY